MKNIRKRILSLGVVGALSLLPGIEGKAEILRRDDTSINNNYLDKIDDNHIYKDFNNKGVTTNNVNLRVGASLDDDIITVISDNTEIDILGVVDDSWYLVDYNNNLGYIYFEYVKIIDKNEILEEVKYLPSIVRKVVALDEVNLREEASIDSNKIDIISKKDEAIVLGRYNEDWYQVNYDGKVGYINSKYVKEKNGILGNALFMISLKKDEVLTDIPFGDTQEYLDKYEACFVYGETSTHYLVESEGRVGYIKKDSCVKLEGRFVIVDISSQKLVLFDGVLPLIVSDVVTGKDSTPTDLGLYDIHTMQEKRVLNGEDYSVLVNYWMGFNKEAGEGLHDIKRSKFGGEIYHKKGSHGCVNMPLKKAESLYQNVEEGDKVLIKR